MRVHGATLSAKAVISVPSVRAKNTAVDRPSTESEHEIVNTAAASDHSLGRRMCVVSHDQVPYADCRNHVWHQQKGNGARSHALT